MERKRMLIGGEWVEAKSGEYYENVNPATEEVVCEVPLAGREDVDVAVEAAERVRDEGRWAADFAERGALLYKLAERIEERADELARMESTDMGKPYSQSTGDMAGAAKFFRYYGGLADKIEGETLATPTDTLGYTLREPYGVVAAIIPWNFPLCMTAIKGGPALAAGNCVIFKPASPSPSTALALGEMALEVGFPPGVIQVVTGPGSSAGARLARHPGVGKVSLTGSTEVGRKIIEASAHNIAKVTLELGGKTANIVLPGADMEMALAAAARTIFLNCGQICTAGSRLLLHEEIKSEFLGRLTEIARSLKVGDPFDEDTKIGPISCKQQYESVMSYIQSGIDEGAEVVTGCKRPDDLPRGYYCEPSIFDNVECEMVIAQEEIFGPVLSVMTYSEEDEAVEIANATEYGLAAALWTRDLGKAHNMAERLQAGIIWINCTNVVGPWMPYGGYKASGLGFEGGMEGLKEFTRTKTVVIDTSNQANPWALE